jgi:hypothetical protein
MATSSMVYRPGSEEDAKFIEILEMFKHISPAINERLQNPDKDWLRKPKKASKVNEFGYYNNPGIKENGSSDQVQLLKEWYMIVNVLLTGNYVGAGNANREDIHRYNTYVIDEVKEKIDKFKGVKAISYNIMTTLQNIVDGQYDNALDNPKYHIKLDRHKLYIINALKYLMDNFAPLKDKTIPVRIQSLALNETTNGKKYNIERLNYAVFEYVKMMKNPITSLDISVQREIGEEAKAAKEVEKAAAKKESNARISELEEEFKRIFGKKPAVSLRKGGKHRKHRLTKKRSMHKKKTQKRRKH